ncbi:spore maturation protein B [Lachnospiraceae bacterium KM106-2]|nr:spore maturation protein B [Lachnospiraceae bacterium KM106-2]
MSFLLYVSDYIIPLLIFIIVGYGLLCKISIYDEFVKGAKDGLKVVVGIVPTLVGLMIAIGILRSSGALDMIANATKPFVDKLLFPAQLVPLVIVKMFSSSAAISLLLDIFKQYGPDSYYGRLASIIMSCTETIFYTMAIYFMTAGVKKTRYTLVGALIATFAGVVGSVIITKLVFG